ncbi:MAG: phage tail sheath subtilisin-like domain-containing protein [Anaerolineae bacterium]|jgi:hypothetical protein|nr:phage tail sheath subtilisin-like domain-containing protein [Anaerolineae bacterium]
MTSVFESPKTPGVYLRSQASRLRPAFRTGVPVFLGSSVDDGVEPRLVENLAEFQDFCQTLGNSGQRALRTGQVVTGDRGPKPLSRLAKGSFLPQVVRGFFANGGQRCYVALYAGDIGFDKTLAGLALLNDVDLVCAPDIMRALRDLAGPAQANRDRAADQAAQTPARCQEWATRIDIFDWVVDHQRQVLNHCQALGNRFAILDGLPICNLDQWITERRYRKDAKAADRDGLVHWQRSRLSDDNGALYFPWIRTLDGPTESRGFIPPCGHIAGIYAAADARDGVHKAPANEVIEGALDVQVRIVNAYQDELNPENINCLRSFPGRGIRVWGARTLSTNPVWQYVSVRRVFLTAARWIELNLADVAFEPNDDRLWPRIERDLTGYFTDLFRKGALHGATAEEAFYVKCNAETNPPELRDTGQVVTEIGLAAAAPAEFIVIRITHGSSGVTVAGP